MWIGDVEIPEPLINAHRAGNLALFVGAGASRSSPSDLPDFRGLTAEIAAESAVVVTDAQLNQPDQLLGDLAEQHHVGVHLRVATRIGVPTSQPNRLHEAIAALAETAGRVRIVTTNYDLHLSSALAARGLARDEYMAPALPMGDDFSGLVYLHGSPTARPIAGCHGLRLRASVPTRRVGGTLSRADVRDVQGAVHWL